jgi:hypothetical protein
MQRCQKCNSGRIMNIDAKTSDMCTVYASNNRPGELEPDYVPDDIGLGGGDYLSLSYCLECGQIQGNFPLPKTELEGGGKKPEWELSETYADDLMACEHCQDRIEPDQLLVVATSPAGDEKYFCTYKCAEEDLDAI